MKIVSPNASELVREVVHDFVDFVGKTYGPAGKAILIQDNFSVRAVDDGKTVAESYELKDESKNAIVLYIKEALSKTDQRVGDGTTTAAILTGAIVEATLGKDSVGGVFAKNPQGEIELLKKGLIEAVAQIEKASKPVKTKDDLYKVAYNSYNNEEIASLISETLFKIGKDGIISVEDSMSVKTEVEVEQGTEIKKGYVSPYFVNERDRVVLKDSFVLLVNKKLDSLKDMTPFLQLLGPGKNMTIIAEGFGEEVIGFFVLSKMQGAMKPLLIENPMFGEHRMDFLKDISAVCGGLIIDDTTNVTFTNFKLEDLGRAQSIVAKKDTTIITGGKGKKSDLDTQVKDLKARLEAATNPFEKDKLAKRIAVLTGGVAVLKIGADTEHEQKTKKLKVEDSVNAAKVAYANGIVQGGGETYQKIKTSSEVLNKALKAPKAKLIENGEEFLDKNVVDPTSVLVAALESAVSIASGLITMGGVIATKREDKKNVDY